MPTLYDRCSLIGTESDKLSTSSITEVVEIRMKSVKFVYLESMFFSNFSVMELCSEKLNESYERLKDFLIARQQICEDSFSEHKSKNRTLNLAQILSDCNASHQDSYIIILRQIVGKKLLPSSKVQSN